MARDFVLSEEDIETEIKRLQASPYVKLAKKEERIRHRRRQYMYTLRMYEKKGKHLAADGVTIDNLDELVNEIDEDHVGQLQEFY